MDRTTTFAGHPLIPQDVPLSRAERREAEMRLALSGMLENNPQILEQLVDANYNLRKIATQAASGPGHRRVLFSGLAQLDGTGVWSRKAGGGNASGALWVHALTSPLIAVAGPRTLAPPNQGAGVFACPVNVPVLLNAHTPEWTLFGAQVQGMQTFPIPNPASATGFTYTVTDELALDAVTFTLTTSATAGTRAPQVTFFDPSGNLITASTAGGDGSTSAARVVTFTPYSQSGAGVGNGVVSGAIPNLTLQPGSTIVVSTAPGAGFQAGDQISGATVTGTASGSIVASGSGAGAQANVTMFSDSVDPGI